MAVDLNKSRRILPAPMIDRSSYSIFSVIKQAIGKDLTRFAVPVIWNEPLSFLQRLAETVECSYLLDKAVSTTSSTERFHLITAFIVSNLSGQIERTSKPFNPLLGETYELKMEGHAPFHFISEQVSHHPPISALYCYGRDWTLTANIEPQIKFSGTNIIASSKGYWHLRIAKNPAASDSISRSSFVTCPEEFEDNNDEEYTWESPSVVVHNILFGHLWCDFQGNINIEKLQSNQRAILKIKTHSWFASQATKLAETFKFDGFVYDGTEKVSAFHGSYGHCYYAIDNVADIDLKSPSRCSIGGNNCINLNSNNLVSLPCDLILTPSSRLIWYRNSLFKSDEELQLKTKYHFFTPYAMSLNEQVSSILLPPTDCRFRKDIRYLENGEFDAAAAEKHRLEEQQRAEAKAREGEFQPLWFKKNDKQEYIYTENYGQRNFNRCPNLFSQ